MPHSQTYDVGKKLGLLQQINQSPAFDQFNNQCSRLIIGQIDVEESCHLATKKFDLYILRGIRIPVSWGILSGRDAPSHIVARGELDKRSLSTGVEGFFLPAGNEMQSANELFSLWADYMRRLADGIQQDSYSFDSRLHKKMIASWALTKLKKPEVRKIANEFLDPLFAPTTPKQRSPSHSRDEPKSP